MNVMLGNMTIPEIEARVGFKFPAELVDYMAERHQAHAENIGHGKWHCFDIPFSLVCGDVETATEIHKHLVPFASDFKQQMQIAISTTK